MYGMFRSELPRIIVCASGSGSNFEELANAYVDGRLKAKIQALVVDRMCFAVERAKKFGIPHVLLQKPWYVDFEKIIENLSPDLIVLAGFMRIIPEETVRKYFPKIINIHPSLLPSFPGKDGIKQAFDYGVKVTGITIHFVDSGVDTGPIIFQKAIEIQDDWNIEDLEREIHKLEHEYYWQIVNKILYTRFEIHGRKVTWGE
ncbi:MAG: phosphoribosylglycinamide formyltransferase [Fervidobacterium sp.]